MGVEALARWNHKILGLMEPGGFLDLAEEAGLVGESFWPGHRSDWLLWSAYLIEEIEMICMEAEESVQHWATAEQEGG